jgi:hypothetical protein
LPPWVIIIIIIIQGSKLNDLLYFISSCYILLVPFYLITSSQIHQIHLSIIHDDFFYFLVIWFFCVYVYTCGIRIHSIHYIQSDDETILTEKTIMLWSFKRFVFFLVFSLFDIQFIYVPIEIWYLFLYKMYIFLYFSYVEYHFVVTTSEVKKKGKEQRKLFSCIIE